MVVDIGRLGIDRAGGQVTDVGDVWELLGRVWYGYLARPSRGACYVAAMPNRRLDRACFGAEEAQASRVGLACR